MKLKIRGRKMDRLEFIAKVRYLGWICYQMGANLPLHDVPNDYRITDERLEGLIDSTNKLFNTLGMTPEENHINWMKNKIKQGYTYGEVLDVEKKTHPSLVPFDELSEVEQRKDEMDILMTKLANRLYFEL